MEDILNRAMPILKPLWAAGAQAYLVGGCVRDTLLGRPVHDLDVATSALPQQVKEIFAECRVVDTGIKYGTVTLVCAAGAVEITTFRREGTYSDHRRPDGVSFTSSLEEDLKRRDFTINAMALGAEGLVDFFDGQGDLKAGLLRCVGDADARLREDALRVLRGLRFAATLDMELEEATARAIERNAPMLAGIAQERITVELMRILCGDAAGRVLVDFPGVMEILIPELGPSIGFDQKTPYHCYDVYTHCVKVIEHVPPKLALRLAALLHDVAKPATFQQDQTGVGHFPGHALAGAEMVETILPRLRLDKQTQRDVPLLIAHHSMIRTLQVQEVPKLLAQLGPELFFDLVDLGYGDSRAKPEPEVSLEKHWERLRQTAKLALNRGICLDVKDLAVDGGDVMAAGFSGVEVGMVLRTLLNLVLEGDMENQRKLLLRQIARMRGQMPQPEGRQR